MAGRMSSRFAGAGFAAQGLQAFPYSSYSFPSTRQSCNKQVTAQLKVQPMRQGRQLAGAATRTDVGPALSVCAVCQEVEDTDESAIYERATWDRLPLDKWSAADGRVLLLGDAAHAMYSGEDQTLQGAINRPVLRDRGLCLQPEACLSGCPSMAVVECLHQPPQQMACNRQGIVCARAAAWFQVHQNNHQPVHFSCAGALSCAGPGQGARTAFEDAHQMYTALEEHWPDAAAVATQYEVS